MPYFQKHNIELYAEQTSKHGDPYCGDSFYYTSTNDYFICILADGLGSGKYAYESSSVVAEIVKEHHEKDIDTLMKMCNSSLASKRGAAVAILKVFYHSREFVYSCVGNIRFYLYSPEGKLTYPLPVTGYLSGRPQKYKTQRFSFQENSRFLIHSDGLNITGVKNILQQKRTMRDILCYIQHYVDDTADDTTYMIGSLL
ncbi:PP2C family serine/threonine-protein phosphatase [Bacillus seohaeanensis]|jgi:phosphoserine phosphatase RsbX|uniref:PP2C family serine/threonine-protein phosphatase n=1 Tax=Bacillus seohaeanensis TaxID=284580 RepID=A0ABW5RQU8_9BACI